MGPDISGVKGVFSEEVPLVLRPRKSQEEWVVGFYPLSTPPASLSFW